MKKYNVIDDIDGIDGMANTKLADADHEWEHTLENAFKLAEANKSANDTKNAESIEPDKPVETVETVETSEFKNTYPKST